MVLEVYLDPCTVNSRKVLAGLDLMGAKYHYNHVDYFAGEHKSEHYSKNVNPHETVPAAIDGDLKITESNAILQYAADITDGGEKYYPRDFKERAKVNKWLLWESSVWFQSCYVYLIENVVKPLQSAEPDKSVTDAEAPRWEKGASILNDDLGKTKYVCGDHITIADIAIASPMHLHKACRFPMDRYPNLQRWIKDIEALPEWKNTQDAVEKKLLPNKQTNGNSTNGETGTKSVRTTLNYTKDLSNTLTEIYFYEDEEGKWKNIHEPGDAPEQVQIYDAWSKKDEWDVDKNGFSLKDFHSEYSKGWEDDEGVRSKFYPEVVEFLKKTVGAKEVLVFDHTVRTKKNQNKKITQETNTSQRAPVRLVHCDYTSESAPIRVKQLLPDKADDLLKRHVAFINVWKPLAKVEEMPLAMCDIHTSQQSDFFKLFLRYRDRTGENYVMKYNPEHKWWYFPNMTPEQVILLKTYDSDEDKARFVGHSAFEDPTTKPDAPYRESIEIRTIAFF